jgi:hypothetical protein
LTARRRRAGLTLVEVALASALLLILAGVVFSSMIGTTETVDTTAAITDSQLEAERIARRVREELQRSGILSPADLTISTNPQTLADDRVDYTPLSRDAPLFDPDDPWNVPYETLPERIAFEADGREVLGNGKDDDGDLLVDEGRVTLYRGGEPVATLGRNVSRIEYEQIAPQGMSGLPALKVTVVVQRVNRTAIRGVGDLQGALRTHTSTSLVTLLN